MSYRERKKHTIIYSIHYTRFHLIIVHTISSTSQKLLTFYKCPNEFCVHTGESWKTQRQHPHGKYLNNLAFVEYITLKSDQVCFLSYFHFQLFYIGLHWLTGLHHSGIPEPQTIIHSKLRTILTEIWREDGWTMILYRSIAISRMEKEEK